MPIPNATEATVATEKVRDYLLNPEHPDGGSKAAWFQSLRPQDPPKGLAGLENPVAAPACSGL
jgi:hypothetical protein